MKDRMNQIESERSKLLKEFLDMGNEVFDGNNNIEFIKEATKKGKQVNKPMREELKLMKEQLKKQKQ